MRAQAAVERADVALVLIDAAEGLTAQDAHIAGLVADAYVGMVLVANKWDLVAAGAGLPQGVQPNRAPPTALRALGAALLRLGQGAHRHRRDADGGAARGRGAAEAPAARPR